MRTLKIRYQRSKLAHSVKPFDLMPLAILKCEKILKWNILFPAKE